MNGSNEFDKLERADLEVKRGDLERIPAVVSVL